MLTLEPARQRRRLRRSKIAVALAGGGPLGFFYELGALHALDEALEGRALVDVDLFTGVSSGALVAAGLANGIDTTTMCEAYIYDSSAELPFSHSMLLQPAMAEYLKHLCQLPEVLTRALQGFWLEPDSGVWSAAMRSIGRMIPPAIFDNKPLETYLRALFRLPGCTDDFRKLRARLYIVATNLNTVESVPFGTPGRDTVPISRAVLASAALPGLYAPVRIDGEQYVDGALVRTMNASLALDQGADLVICINPLVPFDTSKANGRARRNIAHEGLPTVLSQTFRSLIYSRMKVGMASYGLRFPAVDSLLLEPDRHDEQLFFANVFRYSGRRRLAEHAYQCTRRDLLRQASPLAALLKRHGLALNEAVLKDRGRTLLGAVTERRHRAQKATRNLDRALGQLESVISRRSGA